MKTLWTIYVICLVVLLSCFAYTVFCPVEHFKYVVLVSVPFAIIGQATWIMHKVEKEKANAYDEGYRQGREDLYKEMNGQHNK